MRKILMIISLFGFFSHGYSQDPLVYDTPHNNSENLNDANNMLVRYWYYRWRLQNDFLIIGDQPGHSIPAEDREGKMSESLRWGDGTIWLGNYICMLALENALIRYSNRYFDLKKNERELYYAMQAFNRLDEQGDTYYDAGDGPTGNGTRMLPCKNGFFIRDDVPANFFTTNYSLPNDINHPFGNNPNPNFNISDISTWNTTMEYTHFTSGKSGINFFYHPFVAFSDGGFSKHNVYVNNNGLTYDVPNANDTYVPITKLDEDVMEIGGNMRLYAMSQDQVYRLLLGFATVIRSIPYGNFMVDTDDDGVEDTPFNFVEEAKIHCTNMIGRLNGLSTNVNRTDPYLSDFTCSQMSQHYPDWVVVDPIAEKLGIGDVSLPYCPQVSDIWLMYYSSQNNITGLDLNKVINEFQQSLSSLHIILNASTIALTSTEPSNAKLSLYTCLVSGFIPNQMQWHDGVFNRLFNISRGNINHPTKYFGWHTYMMPLYCYLHQFHPQNSTAKDNWLQTRSDMTIEVSSAPCWGPYNYVESNENDAPFIPTSAFEEHYGPGRPPMGINGWNTTFRFDQRAYRSIHGFVLGDNPDNKQVDGGFFNGIDYMSEVNLYYITSNTYTSQNTTLPFYQNLIDRFVDYDVSSDNTPMLGAFNTLTIVKTISGNGQLDIQAGSLIHLQDGTHITTSQPSKHLFIKIFSCDNVYNGVNQSPVVSDSSLELNSKHWAMNNDYGFNEEFPTKQYDVHPYMDNAPTTQEILEKYQINNSDNVDSIVLYPNPTHNEFSIKNTENTLVECKVYVLSTDGKNIQVEQTRGKYDISTLSPGTYIVHLIFPSGAVADKKLIILP